MKKKSLAKKPKGGKPKSRPANKKKRNTSSWRVPVQGRVSADKTVR